MVEYREDGDGVGGGEGGAEDEALDEGEVEGLEAEGAPDIHQHPAVISIRISMSVRDERERERTDPRPTAEMKVPKKAKMRMEPKFLKNISWFEMG